MKNQTTQMQAIKNFAVFMSKELTDKLGQKVKNSLIREAISHYFGDRDWNTFIGKRSPENQLERTFKNEDVSVNLIAEKMFLLSFDFCKESKILRVTTYQLGVSNEIDFLLEENDLELLKSIKNIKDIEFNEEDEEKASDNIVVELGCSISFFNKEKYFSFEFNALEDCNGERKSLEKMIDFFAKI